MVDITGVNGSQAVVIPAKKLVEFKQKEIRPPQVIVKKSHKKL